MSLGIRLSVLIGPSVPLPAPIFLVKAIQSVEITNSDELGNGFEITFSVGRGGMANEISDYFLVDNPLLQPFSRVIITVFFGLIPKVLIDGIITNKQFIPSNDPGKSTMTVTGEDLSIMMDMEEKVEIHPNQPDPVIVNKIILSYSQYGITPMVIIPPSIDVPTMVNRIPSQQGTDLSYVKELAKKYDYIFYIEPTAVPGFSTAYWGPLSLSGIPQKPLSVNMGPETNVNSINFQYNGLAPTLFSGNIQDNLTNTRLPVMTFSSLRPPLSNKPAILNQYKIKKKQFRANGLNIIQAYVQAQTETDKSMDVLTVSGELDTMRYGNILRARRLVGLKGAGYVHDGLYYVKSVTHKIKPGEYKQSFTLSREGVGSITTAFTP